MTKPSGDFRVDILFPDEYRDFIAEIYYKGEFLCLISQEEGFENLELECPVPSSPLPLKLPLTGLEDAISYVRQRLFDLKEVRE